ncbi:efflux RND transporter periplasmic adaptor subunit [Tropicimonas marinistellae]|uniref:efflux RND transporter periplasmic adaptor subunit n=1 Tax=Tropicimonas marinistellae TaxID=1739787 RepID=UPI00137344DD|nr:efflux RND transporter periplasmic adaptor subunit [Tropicimonas marinistellae]
MSKISRQRPLRRRLLTGISSIAFTALTFAVAGVAIVQGADTIAHRAEAAAPPPVAEALPVTVSSLQIETGYETVRSFAGKIEPVQESDLSFEFGGRIIEILVDEGDHVREGDAVARLDISLLEAELARLNAARDALEANLSFAALSVERRQALQERGFTSIETLDRARFDRDVLAAQISETDATIRSVKLRIEKSELRSPYSGTVGARTIDVGTSVAAGVPVVRLMTDGVANVRVGVPLWLEPGELQRATLHSEGRMLPARLNSVRPDIDPLTRTRTAIFRVESTDLPFGSTTSVRVPRTVSQRGAWVDVRALREGASGVWTVLVIDAEDRARHLAVEVQEVQGDRAFVSGDIAPGLRFLTEGPQRVVPGQLVRPIEANSIQLSMGEK